MCYDALFNRGEQQLSQAERLAMWRRWSVDVAAMSRQHTGRAVITAATGPVLWGDGRARSPVKGSRAERWTPALNASEEPMPHQISCNQFRDLHASTSAPPLD